MILQIYKLIYVALMTLSKVRAVLNELVYL